MNRRVSLGISAVLVVGVVMIIAWPRASQAPTNTTNTGSLTNTKNTNTSITNTNTSAGSGVAFSTTDEPDSLSVFTFRTTLPTGWISQYDSDAQMLIFSPLSAGQGDSTDVVIAMTRITGSSWPSVSGGTATTKTIDGHAAKDWSGLTVTTAWHDRFDGWHRGEPMRQLDLQVRSGANGVYYRLTGGPGVSDTEWRTFRDHLQLSL